MSGSSWPTPAIRLHRLSVAAADAAAAEIFAGALESVSPAIDAFEMPRSKAWTVTALLRDESAVVSATIALALAAAANGVTSPVYDVERVAEEDWVRRNQESFPPRRVGRYFVHGSHVRTAPPRGMVGLLIDAASAFGTGEHATTAGCLIALDGLARHARPARVLDMGTGTGILAIAAAKTWHCPVVACDIDANSVRVARENARANGVSALVSATRGDGYRDGVVAMRRPYDLVLANILARPLVRMASSLGRALWPGGWAILSGLLDGQAAFVHAAHRSHGLMLVRRISIEGWSTLLYRAPSRA